MKKNKLLIGTVALAICAILSHKLITASRAVAVDVPTAAVEVAPVMPVASANSVRQESVTVTAPVSAPTSAPITKTEPTQTVVLTKNNTVVLNQEVTGESVSSVLSKLRELDGKMFSGGKPVYMFLNTPGGSIQAGLELIEGVQGAKRPVNTITLFAASMGFQIAQNLGERLILKNGTLMSHRAEGGFEGQFGGQSPSQIDSRYGFWLSRLNEMDAKTVERSKGKQTMASYQASYATEMWRTGTQSVDQGYADKVVKVSCDSSLDGVSTNEINFMGMKIKYDLSNCPLNTSPTNIRLSIKTNKGIMSADDFVAKSGGFGYGCLEYAAKNEKTVCASDLNLTLESLYGAKSNFSAYYDKKQNTPIRMVIGK